MKTREFKRHYTKFNNNNNNNNDHSDDNEDNEPDNTAGKRQRKTYASTNTIRKEMTKQRCADVLKKQQEKEKAKI